MKTIKHARLMDESESRVGNLARSGTPIEQLVAGRILEHPLAYSRWEAEHAQLMRHISSQARFRGQMVATRETTLALVHRKALFDYMRTRAVTGGARHKLIQFFYGSRDYAGAVVAEHGHYLRSASSYWCSCHIARRLMLDSVFVDPLALYEERYTDYFRLFCDCILADGQKVAAEPLRHLLPYLKQQLADARRAILALPGAGNRNTDLQNAICRAALGRPRQIDQHRLGH